VDVRLVRQLDRRESPLLQSTGQHGARGRLSTMDRCVEPLCDDNLAAFFINARLDLSTDSNRSVVMDHGRQTCDREEEKPEKCGKKGNGR